MGKNAKEIKVISTAKPKKNPYKNDIISDDMGQWKYPGQPTRIHSGDITMNGVPYPVLGVDNLGNQELMLPGMDYTFPGQYVDEFPMARNGGTPKSLKKYTNKNIKSSINYLMRRNETLFGPSGKKFYRPMQDGGAQTPEEWENEIRAVEGSIGNPSTWTLESHKLLQDKLNAYKAWRENTTEGKAVVDYHNEPNEYVIPLPSHLQAANKGDAVGDYNMERALELGYNPNETGHWPSVDSETGMWLKSKSHPTAWKEFMYGQLNADLAKNYDVRANPEGTFGENQLQYVPKKQNGGWLDEYQPGGPKKKEPIIYVTDPNDPRLLAHNDSALLYNNYNQLINSLNVNEYKEVSPNHSGQKVYGNWNLDKNNVKKKPNSTGLKKESSNLYSVNDFIFGIINKNLPKQLFSDKIDPVNVKIFTKGSVYGDNIYHIKEKNGIILDELEKDDENWLTSSPDYRVVPNYSNVNPKQKVVYRPENKPSINTSSKKPTNPVKLKKAEPPVEKYWTKKDVTEEYWNKLMKKYPGAIGLDPTNLDKDGYHNPIYPKKKEVKIISPVEEQRVVTYTDKGLYDKAFKAEKDSAANYNQFKVDTKGWTPLSSSPTSVKVKEFIANKKGDAKALKGAYYNKVQDAISRFNEPKKPVIHNVYKEPAIPEVKPVIQKDTTNTQAPVIPTIPVATSPTPVTPIGVHYRTYLEGLAAVKAKAGKKGPETPYPLHGVNYTSKPVDKKKNGGWLDEYQDGGSYSSEEDYQKHLLDPYSPEKREAQLKWLAAKNKTLKSSKAEEKAQWEIDRDTKEAKPLGYLEALFNSAFTTDDYGKKDYSDFSSFNSAFRNAREADEKEFIFKGRKFNTNLVPKKDSDEYLESKKFLQKYYKEQPYRNMTISDSLDLAEDFTKSGLTTKTFELLHNPTKEFTEYINKNKHKEELDNLNAPYYFSISSSKPESMAEDGYLDKKNKKIFLYTKAEGPEKTNTTYVHELAHKADALNNYIYTPKIDIKALNENKPYAKFLKNQDQFNYLSDPREIEARKMSTLYHLYKNKRNYSNISKEGLDSLYSDYEKNIPYDIKQLLELYQPNKEDLRKYLNNDYSFQKEYQQGGQLNFSQMPKQSKEEQEQQAFAYALMQYNKKKLEDGQRAYNELHNPNTIDQRAAYEGLWDMAQLLDPTPVTNVANMALNKYRDQSQEVGDWAGLAASFIPYNKVAKTAFKAIGPVVTKSTKPLLKTILEVVDKGDDVINVANGFKNGGWLDEYQDGGQNYGDDYSKSRANMNMLELSQNTPAPKKKISSYTKTDLKPLPYNYNETNLQKAQEMLEAKAKEQDKMRASERLAYSRMTKAQKEKYDVAKAKEEYVNNPGFMDYASQLGHIPLLAMSNPFNMGEKLKELRAIEVNDNLSSWQKFDQMGNVGTEATTNALLNALTEGLTEGLLPGAIDKLSKLGRAKGAAKIPDSIYQDYFNKLALKDHELQKLHASQKIDYETYDSSIKNYEQQLVKELGLENRLGSGSYGEVYELAKDPSKVVKLGRPMGNKWTPELIEDLKSVKQNANIAIPEEVLDFEIPSLYKGYPSSKKQAMIMPNLNKASAQNLDLNKRDRYALFLKQARQLRDRGIKLDVDNMENFKFNEDKGVFDIYDINPGSFINPSAYMQYIKEKTRHRLLEDMRYKQGGAALPHVDQPYLPEELSSGVDPRTGRKFVYNPHVADFNALNSTPWKNPRVEQPVSVEEPVVAPVDFHPDMVNLLPSESTMVSMDVPDESSIAAFKQNKKIAAVKKPQAVTKSVVTKVVAPTKTTLKQDVDLNTFNSPETYDIVVNRQKEDYKKYHRFTQQGSDIMNRTDMGRNKDSEKYIQDLLSNRKDNSVIIDIGSALGNKDSKLAGVSVKELYDNPIINQKAHIIATDIPSEMKVWNAKKDKYAIDVAEVSDKTFNTDVQGILNTKKLNADHVILRAANSIDLIMDANQTVEHFKHLGNTLKDKEVTYVYNNAILYKPKGSTKFAVKAKLNNAAFDHKSADGKNWVTDKNRKSYTNLSSEKEFYKQKGGQVNWLDEFR